MKILKQLGIVALICSGQSMMAASSLSTKVDKLKAKGTEKAKQGAGKLQAKGTAKAKKEAGKVQKAGMIKLEKKLGFRIAEAHTMTPEQIEQKIQQLKKNGKKKAAAQLRVILATKKLAKETKEASHAQRAVEQESKERRTAVDELEQAEKELAEISASEPEEEEESIGEAPAEEPVVAVVTIEEALRMSGQAQDAAINAIIEDQVAQFSESPQEQFEAVKQHVDTLVKAKLYDHADKLKSKAGDVVDKKMEQPGLTKEEKGTLADMAIEFMSPVDRPLTL